MHKMKSSTQLFFHARDEYRLNMSRNSGDEKEAVTGGRRKLRNEGVSQFAWFTKYSYDEYIKDEMRGTQGMYTYERDEKYRNPEGKT
jgi:hypothetical protein